MNQQNDYNHWEYQLIRYIPVTPKGGGEIEWKECHDYREIHLPSDVEDPAAYLEESARNEFREYMEYRNFSKVTQS